MQYEFRLSNYLNHFFENRPWVHVNFWLIYLCFYGLVGGSYDDNYSRSFFIELIELPVKLAIVYANLYFFMPRYLFSKKYVTFFGLLMMAMLLAGITQRFVVFYIIYPMHYPEASALGLLNPLKIIKGIININSVLVFTATIKVLKLWYKNQQNTKALEKEKLASEIKFLKTQIHPHFLFNTLNNLYALTLKKSDKAPEVVLKLSELLSYMLYDTNGQRVPIAKEINYIKNYLALEKIRYGDRFKLNFNIAGDIHSQQIAPILLLPFIENGFKHGVSREIEGAWINIDLSVKNNFLHLKVENSLSSDHGKKTHLEYAEGIGLKNVQRRLELIYPNAHQLEVHNNGISYLIDLKLSLN